VTVGREGDKVKPNGKKRMNLRATAQPRATILSAPPLSGNPMLPGIAADQDRPAADTMFRNNI
jgi:hypothetical protein